MEFDCGQKGLLKLTFYKECKEENLENNDSKVTGKLCFTFNDHAHEIEFEYAQDKHFGQKLALNVLKKCFPDAHTQTMRFNRASHGVLSLHDDTDRYESNLSESTIAGSRINKDLHDCLGCVATYLRGEKKNGRNFNF